MLQTDEAFIYQNMPAPATAFIGRQTEFQAVHAMLDQHRLITLVGLGGIGKTRLAIQIAQERIHHLRNGVCFVPLTALTTLEAVISAISEQLGFSFHGHEEPAVQLAGFLRDKAMLIVLDNFEQLTPFAPYFETLLTRVPELHLLVTSRVRLNLYGEVVYFLNGLACPDGSHEQIVDDSDSVQLYVDAARRQCPDFQVDNKNRQAIVRICRQLGGLPLGIELAASWSSVLSAQSVLDEIGDGVALTGSPNSGLPDRHQRLERILDNTWALLSTSERDTLRRMVIFPASFDRDAVQRITGATAASLVALIDRAMLYYEEGRYTLHPVVRGYVLTKLEADTAAYRELRAAHADYYLTLLSDFDRNGIGEGGTTFQELATEIDQIDAAWQAAVAMRNETWLERSIDGLFWFSLMRSDYSRCSMLMKSLTNALQGNAAVQSESCRLLLATAHARHAYLLASLHRQDEATAVVNACQQALGSDTQTALWTLCSLATVQIHCSCGEFAQAFSVAEETLADAPSQLSERDRLLLYQLAILAAINTGETGAAKRYLAALKASTWNRKSAYFEAYALAAGSYMAFLDNDYDLANVNLIRAIHLFETHLDNKHEVARCYYKLGWIQLNEWKAGGLTDAEISTRKALSIFRFLGDRRFQAESLNNLALIHIERLEFSQAQSLLEEGLDHALAVNDRTAQSIIHSNLGDICVKTGNFARALRYYEEGESISRDTLGGHTYSVHFQVLVDFCLLETGQPRRFDVSLAESIWRLSGQSIDRYIWRLVVELLVRSQQLDDAKRFALAYFDTYRQSDEPKQYDIKAWLAYIAFQQGDMEEAMAYVESILAHINPMRVDRLTGAERPFHICWVCHQVLIAADDERASALLGAATIWLRRVAFAISDSDMRRSFLHDVPAHRVLLAASAAETASVPAMLLSGNPLTPREREVLHLIALGLTNRQIADRLYITRSTVKRHLSNINGKFSAGNRVTLLNEARQLGLVK